MSAALVSPPILALVPAPGGASLARSLDGRWLAVASAGQIWIEDAGTRRQRATAIAAGDDLAVTASRVWVIRGGRLESMDLESGAIEVHEVALGGVVRMCAVAEAVVITGDRGTWIVRDSGATHELAPHRTFVRAVSHTRILIVDNGTRAIVDIAGIPSGIRLEMASRILDASPLFDRTTCLLLVARDDHQELVVMRCSGSVLSRTRVRHVERIAGASQALRVALAIDDGRVIVYDLRERRVLSADRPSTTACEVAFDADGRAVTSVSRHGRSAQLYVRRFD
ncbi:MAG: hypothetical protein JNL83_21525 [Myxococcales bacterium]|nr:hypothetical protein [Myxococcales bacterium]